MIQAYLRPKHKSVFATVRRLSHSAAAFSLSASSCECHQSVLFCWPFSNLRLYKAAPTDTNFMSGSLLEASSLLKKKGGLRVKVTVNMLRGESVLRHLIPTFTAVWNEWKNKKWNKTLQFGFQPEPVNS